MAAHHIAYARGITEFMTGVELSEAERRGFACEFPPTPQLQSLDTAIAWRVTKFAKSDERLKNQLNAFWASSGQDSLSSSIAMKWLIHNTLTNRFNSWDAADVRRAWSSRLVDEIKTAEEEKHSRALKEKAAALKTIRAENENIVRSKLTWTDPATGLMWSTKDNGSSQLTWTKAEAYCSNLSLQGYTDWHLPTIAEIEVLYDSSIELYEQNGDVSPLHIKGDVRPSNNYYFWSSSDSPNPGSYVMTSKWEFSFTDGKRSSAYIDLPNYVGANALCVLHAGAATSQLTRETSAVISPTRLRGYAASYPPEAKWRHVQGQVTLDITIATNGSVRQTEVISGPELLRNAAVDAVSQWRYQPTVRHGVPQEVKTRVTINFKLGG